MGNIEDNMKYNIKDKVKDNIENKIEDNLRTIQDNVKDITYELHTYSIKIN